MGHKASKIPPHNAMLSCTLQSVELASISAERPGLAYFPYLRLDVLRDFLHDQWSALYFRAVECGV